MDARSHQLLRSGAPVTLTRVQFDLLLTLVTHAGTVLDKDALMKAVWGDQLVSESSIHRMVWDLRRLLDARDRRHHIQNLPRQGYCFSEIETLVVPDPPASDLDALIAPHRIWIEGRAALETLKSDGIVRERSAIEALVARHPHPAPFHVGLADICVLQFEMTRTDTSGCEPPCSFQFKTLV